MAERPEQLIIYTDGACSYNPGPGGWAAILIWGNIEKIITGREHNTTNNRMELMSVIAALGSLKYACEISLYTDSKYVQLGIQQWLPNWRIKNWRTASGQMVKNRDLWEKLDLLAKPHQINWHWVKGHSGDPLNEKVDFLAKKAIMCDK